MKTDTDCCWGALVFLATAVVAVPLARRLGLSPIVGYILAGVAIGPSGIGAFDDPERIITVAEIGVVLLLFIIGLELQFSRLLALRRAIFGLGTAQLLFSGAAIAVLTHYAAHGFDWRGALVAGMALALSATSIALQLLEEKERAFPALRPAGLRGAAVPGHGDRAAARPHALSGAGRARGA
ncbi:cation:proton antiporter [Ancylobacter dichloromethanicus]